MHVIIAKSHTQHTQFNVRSIRKLIGLLRIRRVAMQPITIFKNAAISAIYTVAGSDSHLISTAYVCIFHSKIKAIQKNSKSLVAYAHARMLQSKSKSKPGSVQSHNILLVHKIEIKRKCMYK